MPRLTECLITISWAGSSQAELSSGVRCRARQTALATISSRRDPEVRGTPAAPSVAPPVPWSRVTSQVTHSVTCGAVKADCTMASAVALRTPLIGIRVSRRMPPRRRERPGPAAAGSAARRRRGRFTSSRVITPPGPLPLSAPDRLRDPWPACEPEAWPGSRRPTPRGGFGRRPDPAADADGARRRPAASASRPSARRETGASVAKVARPTRRAPARRPDRAPPTCAAGAWSRRLGPVADQVRDPSARRLIAGLIGSTTASAAVAGSSGTRSAAGAALGTPSSIGDDRRADVDRVALADQQGGHRSRVGAGQLDQRLAGLHLDHDVVDLDLVADRHPPGDDVGLDQTLARIGQPKLLDRHRCRDSLLSRRASGRRHVQHPVQIGQVLVLDPARRVGHVEAADPEHRRLQGVEALLGDPGRELRAQAEGQRRLVHRDHAARSSPTDAMTAPCRAERDCAGRSPRGRGPRPRRPPLLPDRS